MTLLKAYNAPTNKATGKPDLSREYPVVTVMFDGQTVDLPARVCGAFIAALEAPNGGIDALRAHLDWCVSSSSTGGRKRVVSTTDLG